MNKKKLIIVLIFASFLPLTSLKASLQGQLIQLSNALTNLEKKLRTAPPPPLPRDEASCPVLQKTATQQRPKIKRPISAYIPKTNLSQSADIPVAKPKPGPFQQLSQTTPPGGISVAQRIAKIGKEEPEKGAEKPRSRITRTQSARFERSPLEEPAKKTVNWVGLKNTIQQLVSLPSTLPEEKQKKKLEAKETLDAISELVKKTNKNDLQRRQAQLWEAINPILEIDPLLIQSAINTLRVTYPNASAANPVLYKLMTDLYEDRVSFLENEFMNIKPGYNLSKGIRDDIDEGLTYPIEISGEVQEAQINAAKDIEIPDTLQGNERKKKIEELTAAKIATRNFFNMINTQWERLLKLLKGLSEQQKETLKKEGIDVEQYIINIEENKLRAYCKVNQPEGCKPYVSFYKELQTMAQNAYNFTNNKSNYNRSTKTFAIQNIINKLNAFAAYAQDPKICQICLNEDAQKADEQTIEENFNSIKSLFNDLLFAEPNNKKYREALSTIQSIELAEQSRQSKVQRFGAGYQYQN